MSSDWNEGPSLEVSRTEAEEVPAPPEDMRSLFLSTKHETMDVPIKQEKKQEEFALTASTAGPNGIRKRKYGTEDALEFIVPPPARRIALDSAFPTPRENVLPTQDGKVATITSTEAYDETSIRKLEAEDAPELTDSPDSRRRALNSSFRTHRQAATPVKEEEPSVNVKDEPVDSNMEM